MHKKDKTNILVVSTLLILFLTFSWWSAQKAKAKSDELINEFNKIDRSLDSIHDSNGNVNDTLLEELQHRSH